MDEVHRMKPIL